ncbi:hypothetical protein CAP35_09410 [Chitinophagaceae bacterium IBVUCB1]|nr:hypothetical protein CAP35_09410 [Chitinophagaceae bacterium IBVUCB1]
MHIVFRLMVVCCIWLLPMHLYAQRELWGMSASNAASAGVIFKTDSVGNNYTAVYTFSNAQNGKDPYGSLIQAKDGYLYGMTSSGGLYNYGTIFKLHPASGTYTKIHDFDSLNGMTPYGSLCEASNGKLYGMTYKGGTHTVPNANRGVLFEYNPTNNLFVKKLEFINKNGGNPYGSLTETTNGVLYGLCSAGGGDATGMMFRYHINTNVFDLLGSFIMGPAWSGIHPKGNVLPAANGFMYGLSQYGGAGWSGGGVLFKYDSSLILNKLTAVHKFSEVMPDSLQGHEVVGSLVQATNGKLYGMTVLGGTDNAGTIFEYDTSTAKHKKLYNFDSTLHGYCPQGSLMQASDGKLYGLTTSEKGQAKMFQYDVATNSLTIKANIAGTPYYTTLIETKNIPVSVGSMAVSNGYVVYPNPVNDKLYIKTAINDTEVTFISTDGKLVLQQPCKDFIDVSNVPDGLYIIKLTKGAVLLHTETVQVAH